MRFDRSAAGLNLLVASVAAWAGLWSPVAVGGPCDLAFLADQQPPGANGAVRALLPAHGGLYAAGSFTQVGEVPANRVAFWDGTVWTALGNGLTHDVYALALFQDEVVAGGFFTVAGGAPADYLARWDAATSSWQPLGSGFNNWVIALTVFNGELYAGGNFTTPGRYIARWTGSAWQEVGGGVDGVVRAITGFDDGTGLALFAGGGFVNAGNPPVAASRIARFDGTSWQALGTGLNNQVQALIVMDSKLYAAGSFTTAGGQPANRIAAWNGSAWSTLGSGLNNTTVALAVFNQLGQRRLYAGGFFTTAGGQATNRMASWNGTAWSAMSSGPNTTVLSLVAWQDSFGPGLYLGGHFITVGGLTAKYIARWGHQTDCDGDGLPEDEDNCPTIPNRHAAAMDCNGDGDTTDPGEEADGQCDVDGDGLGDACDSDDDNDGILDDGNGSGVAGDGPCRAGATTLCDDNCPTVANADQADTDGDGVGDACDLDNDGDDVPDDVDNCPLTPNGPGDADNQVDTDGDGAGDACDEDDDDDELADEIDNCPRVANGPNEADNQSDTDSDGVGDACDNCIEVPNPDQANHDVAAETPGAYAGDACDADDDNDGVLDDGDGSGVAGDAPCPSGIVASCDDNCPFHPNPNQLDTNADGIGDACESDEDGDGVFDDGNSSGVAGDAPCTAGATTLCDDNCPAVANADQADGDGDGVGDACESDRDADGIFDDGDGSGVAGDGPCIAGATTRCDDNCVGVANPDQADMDGDGIGDACDLDNDGDGVPDDEDNCPTIANGPNDADNQGDADDDGVGNACEEDDDDDGLADEIDNCPLAPNGPNEEDNQTDTDGDGVGDACDNCLEVPNPDQANHDAAAESPGSYAGDACDDDDDNDGILDDGDGSGQPGDFYCPPRVTAWCDDNCPFVANANQADADGDSVGDACDQCANTPPGLLVDRTGCAATPAPGDTDRDGDVDGADVSRWRACAKGESVGPLDAGCSAADADGDGDVDLSDFGLLQRCLNGPGVIVNPACAGQ